MFRMIFHCSVFGQPLFYGLLELVKFGSLEWNTVTIYIRFLLLVEVVSKVWLCVYM